MNIYKKDIKNINKNKNKQNKKSRHCLKFLQ